MVIKMVMTRGMEVPHPGIRNIPHRGRCRSSTFAWPTDLTPSLAWRIPGARHAIVMECDRDFMVIYQGHWEIFTEKSGFEEKQIKDPTVGISTIKLYKTSGLGSFVKVNGKLNGDFL